MKNVIHIFGASGAGTSTLGRKICAELGYRFMDTDDYFWMPTDPAYTEKRPREERIEMMNRDIDEAENVVISGSLIGWGDVLMPRFTLAIRVETDADIRAIRLHLREKEKFGDRIEPGGDMYRKHLEFIEWAKAYDTGGLDMRSKAHHDQWQQLLTCPLVCLDGAEDLDLNFEKVKAEIQ